MKRELKIGDTVRIIKPKKTAGTCWIAAMRGCVGEVSIIKNIDNKEATLKDFDWWFPLSSLVLVEEVTEQVTEQVAEQVAKQIDWEQRGWELLSSLILQGRHIDVAVGLVETAIEKYKQTLK